MCVCVYICVYICVFVCVCIFDLSVCNSVYMVPAYAFMCVCIHVCQNMIHYTQGIAAAKEEYTSNHGGTRVSVLVLTEAACKLTVASDVL